MVRPYRKKIGIDRLQPVLVDTEGQIWSVTSPFFFMRPRQRDGNIVDYAVSQLGFIHIWSIDGSSIVVALRPDLVHPKTMIATFYAIADLRPARVFISVTNTAKQRWELFNSVDRALSRLDRLVPRPGGPPSALNCCGTAIRRRLVRRQRPSSGPRHAAASQLCWRAGLPRLS